MTRPADLKREENKMNQVGWPSTEQIDALKQFAAIHGRYWKSVLRDAWMDGDYRGFENSWLLQQVRNTFGPSWLVRFRLDRDQATGRMMWSVQEHATAKRPL
jgi:hypothetical protein